MATHAPLSTTELRRQNRNRLYRSLTQQWLPATKQELALRLSMSLPTLTQNLNELADMGLIDRSERSSSTGGRRPTLVTPLPNARFALGAELTGEDLRLAAVNLRQETLGYQKLPLPFENTPDYGRRLADLLEAFLDAHQLDRSRLLGVGLTLPGIISPDQTAIQYAPTIAIRSTTPCRFLESIPYPVRLDNDANCGGFGAWWNREGRQSMAYLSLSRGVGGAFLANGRLYEGSDHRAAEFGHMCLHPGGRRCQCGRRGCLEAYCSAARLSDDLGLSLEEFFSALDQGDLNCRQVWERYLRDLALALTSIHAILDCPVIIGGSVSQYLPPFQGQLAALVEELDPTAQQGSFLTLCPNFSRAVCIGAATHFIADFIRQL